MDRLGLAIDPQTSIVDFSEEILSAIHLWFKTNQEQKNCSPERAQQALNKDNKMQEMAELLNQSLILDTLVEVTISDNNKLLKIIGEVVAMNIFTNDIEIQNECSSRFRVEFSTILSVAELEAY
ncbi:YolD-like family protein [Mesobacillus maritimus]|uniref:YolD-like family protein n=1 Tax=Mesobacillus maritimus TaxID=1643336 RepID=UPI0020423718|nr:YolD-like family protein [Mesobacillus maritimus]MCM3671641.1 YolD-like family protein [Mesobacillus maritimus]